MIVAKDLVVGIILGTIAIMISLMALWFAAEAIRRLDARGQGLMRPHLRGLKARWSETNHRINDLEVRLAQIESRLTATRLESRAARDLAEETRAIRHGLRRSREAANGSRAYHA